MMVVNYMCEQSRHPLACEPESVGKEGEQFERAAVPSLTPGSGRPGR
jgi:hypothetical protein